MKLENNRKEELFLKSETYSNLKVFFISLLALETIHKFYFYVVLST